MGAKSEAMATQFEAKAKDAAAVLGKLTDADWKQTTAGEQWTVAATAHHLARSYEAVAGIITMLASGKSLGGFTRTMLDQQNAAQAKEQAHCNRAETVALLEKGAAAAAPVVRGLSDEQLAKSVTVFADAPAMTIEQLVAAALLNHTDEHIGSIRKAAGH
jgi:DinB family protein